MNGQSIGKTANAAITAGSGFLKGVIVHTDGTNTVTLDVYDNAAAASGTKLFSTLTIPTSATNRATVISFDYEVKYENGIYVKVTCAGSVTYDVYFEPK